jgi:CelD/BcsL family acetyltransferase involved in cellulose biosynthesis
MAKTAARSVARLQRIVRASPHLRRLRLRRIRRSSAPPLSSP